MKLIDLYTTVIGKECRNPECEFFGHRKPRKSFPICENEDCGLPLHDVRKFSWPKVLFVPLLLLLMTGLSFLPSLTFLGLDIEHQGFIIILDISGSMSDAIEVARREAQTILEKHRQKWWIFWRHADVIYFDSGAQSVLGGISKLDDDATVARLKQSLSQAWSGGGTNLQSAIEMAAREVVAYGKPTTLLILTDGQDGSIPDMLYNLRAVKSWFKDIQVNAHSTTPRIIFSPVATNIPVNDAERNLRQFSKKFDGKFGSMEKGGGCGTLKTIFQ